MIYKTSGISKTLQRFLRFIDYQDLKKLVSDLKDYRDYMKKKSLKCDEISRFFSKITIISQISSESTLDLRNVELLGSSIVSNFHAHKPFLRHKLV